MRKFISMQLRHLAEEVPQPLSLAAVLTVLARRLQNSWAHSFVQSFIRSGAARSKHRLAL